MFKKNTWKVWFQLCIEARMQGTGNLIFFILLEKAVDCYDMNGRDTPFFLSKQKHM
uniref:Uncharacterized protein n=1 Tax=Arundo donax TaxID=35708 RepID=A0A0A8XTX4_ARUDO